MKKILIIISCLLAMIFAFNSGQIHSETLIVDEHSYIIVNKKKFFTKVADTNEKKIKGLMGIDNIKENQGMLFLFKNRAYRSFWMKNMKISIDILFIYKNKVVKIYKEVPICENTSCPVYESGSKADSVLELTAGSCGKFGIKVGDKVVFSSLVKAKWAKLPE